MRFIHAPLLLIALGTTGWPAAAQSDTSLIAPGAKLEKVFCCGVFLEGPAAAPDAGCRTRPGSGSG